MKIRKWSKVISLLLAVTLTISGCSKSESKEVVATLGDEKIYLDEATFFAKFSQYNYESQYGAFMGADMWTKDFFGQGQTLEETVKEQVMAGIQETHLKLRHAKEFDITLNDDDKQMIEENVKSFKENTDKDVQKKMGATDELVKKLMEQAAIGAKVAQAAVDKAGVDKEVADEDAKQRAISYVLFSNQNQDEEGNETPMTDEEKAALKTKVQGVADQAKAGGDFAQLVADAGVTANDTTYGKDDEILDVAVKTAADGLAEGGVSELIETETGYYLVKVMKENDEDATSKKKDEIIFSRESEAWDKIIAEWMKDEKFEIKEKVWEKVNFEEALVPVETEDTSKEDSTDTKENPDTPEAESGASQTEGDEKAAE